MTGQNRLHYRICEQLGAGGMGVVYKAEDTRLNRTVALKFLSERLAREAEDYLRFYQEAKAAATLNHPNITTIYAIEEDGDDIFIVMEYVEGQELRDVIRALDGPMPVADCIDYARQIAEGLKAAHERGIIHRDIKSSNIMVTGNGRIKLMDFGLAKLAGTSHLTQMGTTLGTAAYMSPEQTRGEETDQRSDIWAFGVVLYEMLVGKLPFWGDYDSSVIYSVLNETPRPIHSVRPEIPPSLTETVDRMLNKDKEARFANIQDVLDRLSEEAPGERPGARKHGVPPEKRFHLSTWRSIGVAVVLSVILASTFFLGRSGLEKPQKPLSLLILPFANKDVKSEWLWLGSAVSDLLRRDLKKRRSLHIISDEQRVRLAGLVNVPDSLSDAMLASVHKAGVDNIVAGQLIQNGEAIEIKTTLHNTKRDVPYIELASIQARQAELFDVARHIAEQLSTALEIPADHDRDLRDVETSSSLDAYRFFIEGQNAGFDLRYREGIQKLKKAIALDSTFVDAYYWLAWQYRDIGDADNARLTLTRGQRYVSGLSEDMKLEYLCNLASIESRWDDYAAHLQNLIGLQPDEAVHHYRYGWVLCNKFRDFEKGIMALRKSIDQDSTNGMVYNELGYAYLAMRDKRQAQTMFEQYLARNAADLNPVDSYADMLVYTGRYDDAIDKCARVRNRKPDFMRVLITLSLALQGKGQFSNAVAAVNEYILQASTPNSENTYLMSVGLTNKAQVLFEMQRYDEALQAAQAAAALDSGSVQALYLIGMSRLRLAADSELHTEITHMTRIIADDGNLDGKWYLNALKSEMALRRDDNRSAVQLLQAAVELRPIAHNYFLTKLADAYTASGEFSAAIEVYQDVLSFNPNYSSAVVGLANAYEKSGKVGAAQKTYQQAKEILADADQSSGALSAADAGLARLVLTRKN
jgi:serine/threonine protein kinase/predicted Zn-dependent protease